MMRNQDNISKENFTLELKSLMDKIDSHIVSISNKVNNKPSTQGQSSKISEVNKLKVFEYKLKEMYLHLPDMKEETWIGKRESMVNTLNEAQEIVE